MGDRVVIDGPCMSACTLVWSVVPNNRICVTRRAVLGFHVARSIDRHNRLHIEAEATEHMLEPYPMPVRDWIVRHGGFDVTPGTARARIGPILSRLPMKALAVYLSIKDSYQSPTDERSGLEGRSLAGKSPPKSTQT